MPRDLVHPAEGLDGDHRAPGGQRGGHAPLRALPRRVQQDRLAQPAGAGQGGGQRLRRDPAGVELDPSRGAVPGRVFPRGRDRERGGVEADHPGVTAGQGVGEEPVAAVEVDQPLLRPRREQLAHALHQRRHHGPVDLGEAGRGEGVAPAAVIDDDPVRPEQLLELEAARRPPVIQIVRGTRGVVEDEGRNDLPLEGAQPLPERRQGADDPGIQAVHVHDHRELGVAPPDDQVIEVAGRRPAGRPVERVQQKLVDRGVLRRFQHGSLESRAARPGRLPFVLREGEAELPAVNTARRLVVVR